MTNTGWTDVRVHNLIAYWERGLSASEIANKLGGVSRSAVIGKLHRLGKTHKSPEAPQRVRDIVAAHGKRGKSNNPLGGRRSSKAGMAKPAARVVPIKPVLNSSACIFPIQMSPAPILDLKPGQCRFALNGLSDATTADTLFCGGPVRPGSSYCEHHHSRCWTPNEKKKRKPATDYMRGTWTVAA